MIKFVKGNEAVVIGALYAGCDAYFGYPITPASEIAHLASEYFPALGKEFLQAECETGSIYMLFGAASAGKLAMTASSGPGISLMQEGVSYLAGAELPGVIVNIMRTGPGLGNVGPEQGDYNQAVKSGGHGNYRSIVLAPGSVQEMCDLTIKAFALSFKYRNPAYVIADAVLGQTMETLVLPTNPMPRPEVKDWAVQGTAETRPNLITSIILEPKGQEQHNIKLQEKYEKMKVEASAELYKTEDADLILVAYGTPSRLSRSAVDELRKRGLKVGLFRPITLYPFPAEQLQSVAKGKQILVVELSNGQLRDDVILHLGMNQVPVCLLNHMGGILIRVEEIIEKVETLLTVKAVNGE